MKKLVLLLITMSSFLVAERITISFREPLTGEDVRYVREAIQRSRGGDPTRIGIVTKRTSVAVQGGRAPLRTIALRLPIELHAAGPATPKLAYVMHVDTRLIADFEAEEMVWHLKKAHDVSWKVFRGTHMYTPSDAPPFDSAALYDESGHFTDEVLGHYAGLPMSNDERQKTYELIHKMGTLEWYKLLWYKSQMEQLGNDVDGVHPLKFTGYIFSDHHLKACMKEVRGFGMKWSRFKGGFSDKMDANFARKNVLPYLPGFCEATGVSFDAVLPFIQARNWEGFLNYMIDN